MNLNAYIQNYNNNCNCNANIHFSEAKVNVYLFFNLYVAPSLEK